VIRNHLNIICWCRGTFRGLFRSHHRPLCTVDTQHLRLSNTERCHCKSLMRMVWNRQQHFPFKRCIWLLRNNQITVFRNSAANVQAVTGVFKAGFGVETVAPVPRGARLVHNV